MKLVRFRAGTQQPAVGVLIEDQILDTAVLSNPPDDLDGLISGWSRYGPALAESVKHIQAAGISGSHPLLYAYDAVEILAPAAERGIIVCVGMNYLAPAAPPENRPHYPVLFLKDQRTIHPPGKDIRLPSASDQVFCEGELVAVIGRGGRDIPADMALDHIFGYTIANDVGAHDLERRTSQWATGKLPDTFLPLGPLLVTADSIADVNNLTIKVAINDQPYLEGSTRDMIFGIEQLIAYISAIKRLEPGDMIVTGSPKGLGNRPSAVRYLKPGDSIAIMIDPIGVLNNGVSKEERDDA